ncbi:MAG TPA: S8 family serine peptidase, partial [Verrucomicrobiae bacterium]|nr:S8 family serine peptidase [Verrucomicrobiae bacterium]
YGGYQMYEVDAINPALANHPRVENRDAYDWVLLNAAPLDTSRAKTQALRKNTGEFAGKHLHLAQFAGPVQPAWRDALLQTGVRIVAYIPHNAYLVYGDAPSLSRFQRWAAAPEVQWEAPYLDDYKVHPAARPLDAKGHPREIGTSDFAIQLVADAEANTNTVALLDQLKLGPLKRREYVLDYLNLVVPLAPENLSTIAAQPDVISIQPYFTPHKLCERQDQIAAGNLSGDVPAGPGYLAWLAGKGFTQAQFTASGFAVDVSDSGIDNGTTSPNHFGLYVAENLANASRVIYNRLEGTPNNGTNSTLAGCDGHGTLNSHIIGGYDDLSGFPFADTSGFHYGLGVCPFVKLGSSVIFDPDSFTSPNYNDLQSQAYQSGARISNNSWGTSALGAYDMIAQNYDALVRDAQPTNSINFAPGNQEMVIVLAADNSGPNPQTIGSPGIGKNVITVGAGESVQPFGGADGSAVDDTGADSANDIIDFSSRGPCVDGRHKPDLMAPGTHVSGGVFQANKNPGSTGTADPCFISNGAGVSGGPSGSLFFPAGQQFYTASSGTSHATPCVSGGCALLRQYFINHFTNAPTPAMTKAYLMNSARYMTGLYANDTLWSDNQGMGEMNLGTAFDGTPRILRDELAADLFTASGQTRTFTGTITDTNKPFRVTIAWTDAPGNTTGAAFNNDLDLTVTVGGNTYKGNVFNGAYSVTGGAADAENNVESVFLPAGLAGDFSVKVTAMDINSVGVPNSNNSNEQDFALVVYNGAAVAVPVILHAGSTLTAESCANGAVDPGETVTVSLALQNIGVLNTTNLVATLQAGGGVNAPGGPQTYGALTAGGSAVSRPFTFTANGICGGTLTATLQLKDGPVNLGAVSFTLPLGQFIAANTFTENFDGVTVPNLPANWSTTTTGAQAAWGTSAAAADTAPNAAYSTDASSVGVNE